MRFSLQVQYAICGVFDLAYNGHGEPVQIRVISERQGVPARYLEQIFGRLRRSEIVASKRGPGGGYTLARTAATITLREVLEAVEGPLEESFAMNDGAAPNMRRPDFLWHRLAARIGDALDATTIEHLCTEAARAEVPRAEAAAPMYFI
jgi:Rrf2 family iron-sulfur cluster assembly transcriptional regulator